MGVKLLQRALKEYNEATDVKEAKFYAFLLLCKYGWLDVFKESFVDGKWKSKEEELRFS